MNAIKFFSILLALTLFISCEKEGASISNDSSGSQTGTAGSLAKFTFHGNFMYVVQENVLKVFNVEDASKAVLLNTVNLNNNAVETIFSNGSHLFFGTQSGLLIYSLSTPEKPSYVSTYSHVVSCDPVVVVDDIAFVTLSTGNRCGRGNNQLEIIDISTISAPKLLKVYPFQNPIGMALNGNYMYLCDKKAGLQILDITDPLKIQVLKSMPSVLVYDAIVNNSILTLTGESGVYQYDITNPVDIKFLSKINKQ